MKLFPNILPHTEAALRTILPLLSPADGMLSRYFRAHPNLGGRERGLIAEGVYDVLRNKLMYANFAESGSGPAVRRLAVLGLANAFGVDAMTGLSEQESEWLTRTMQIDRTSLPIALRTNLPAWLFDKLLAQEGGPGKAGEENVLALANAMNQAAPLDIRVNVLKTTREQVQAELATASIICDPMRYAAHGLRARKKAALQNLLLFKNGMIEAQDEGSQLLAHIVGAKRGEMVVDFCAGAGGKTLALGVAMRNTGRLYAFDIAEKRLAKLKPRLARSGLSNVHPVLIAHENDVKIKRLAGKIDRVLVDSPCSGLGTLRRNPDVKWRQTAQSVAELNVKQHSILAGAARLVKPGGRLVYATCSILNEENAAVVEQFLATHDDFVLTPMSQILAEQKINLEMQDYLQLSPLSHQTDGFFAAVLERKK